MIKIYLDGGCDMPGNEFPVMPVTYRFGNTEYGLDNKISNEEFYNRMKNGEIPKTASVNYLLAKEVLEKEVEAGNTVLCITLSSIISSCYNNISLAASELDNVKVIDSRTGTLAIYLMARKAQEMIDAGYCLDDIINYIEANKLYYHVCVSVNDLKYAVIGGRVKNSANLACKALNLKPNIIVDINGQTISDGVNRGEKKVYTSFAKQVENNISNDSPIGIMHANNITKANILKEQIEELKLDREIIISSINPVIGTYAGPDAIAISYKTKSLDLRKKM